jgi:hypothetical protein
VYNLIYTPTTLKGQSWRKKPGGYANRRVEYHCCRAQTNFLILPGIELWPFNPFASTSVLKFVFVCFHQPLTIFGISSETNSKCHGNVLSWSTCRSGPEASSRRAASFEMQTYGALCWADLQATGSLANVFLFAFNFCSPFRKTRLK